MASVNCEQVEKVANFLSEVPLKRATLNFFSFKDEEKERVLDDMYPYLYHPQAVNYFFFTCMQQFGFWYGDANGYNSPLYGVVADKRVKGSDLLWKTARKTLSKDILAFVPDKLAALNSEKFASIFSDDSGPILFPDFEERFKITRDYAKWFKEHHTSPGKIVYDTNKGKYPLKEFLSITSKIPGYDQDKLQKKNLLLAMVLANRPEKFLNVADKEKWQPVIDYHLMRVSLRLGLVDLDDGQVAENIQRRWVQGGTEKDIRGKTKLAINALIKKSGKSMPEMDSILWMARKYCPEMEEPDCSKCIFTDVCKKRIKLFQPVFRTTNY